MGLWTEKNDGRGNRKITVNLHAGQSAAMDSERRFVAVLAGTQSGKTSWGPIWLDREIDRCGPGDYLAASATYDLFKLKMLPSLLDWFVHTLHIAEYHTSDRILEIPSRGARIILRSAESGGGLESSTAKAAWLDEAGMDNFTIGTWEAVLRRLSLSRGRVLLSTTIYNMGWLKSAVYDKWAAGDPDYDVIQFDSTANPAFPREEYERARRDLPRWKFEMFYRGRFQRPAGLIYDSFDEKLHKVPRFAIPDKWQRYMGLDFGGVHTAALFYAAEQDSEGKETGRLFAYREYLAGGRTAAEHATALLRGESMTPFTVGGSRSEGQWRAEFGQGGLPVGAPQITDVEVGIDRVYGAHKRGELLIFDDLHGYLDQKLSYARVLDAMGEPTQKIDDKAAQHYMDAERYIIGFLKPGGTPSTGFSIL